MLVPHDHLHGELSLAICELITPTFSLTSLGTLSLLFACVLGTYFALGQPHLSEVSETPDRQKAS